jgi:hypothetical protein
MPYPFAHPAAVLPLPRLMGRLAVPSALAIGSIAPDFWYLVPHLARHDTHSLAALAWFCLPAGLLAYLLFHLLLKQPLIALISPRLGEFTPPRLPAAPWRAVILSLAAGAATHLAWDTATHAYEDVWRHNWLQHASSAAGTAILAAWLWRRLRRAPLRPARIPGFTRTCAVLCLAGAAALSALMSADAALDFNAAALRHFARTAGIGALQGLAAALVVLSLLYTLLFQRKIQR